MLAVVLETTAALLAIWLQARGVLSADTNTVADLDATLCLLANAYSLADDFVADAARVRSWPLPIVSVTGIADHEVKHPLRTYPTRTKRVKVRPADTCMGDLNVDIVLFIKRLDLVLGKVLPHHVALGGLIVQAHPALKSVVLGSHLAAVLLFGVLEKRFIEVML